MEQGPLCPVQMEDRVQGPQGWRIKQGFIQVTHELNPEGRLLTRWAGNREGVPVEGSRGWDKELWNYTHVLPGLVEKRLERRLENQ